jgi:hypothetical protein
MPAIFNDSPWLADPNRQSPQNIAIAKPDLHRENDRMGPNI